MKHRAVQSTSHGRCVDGGRSSDRLAGLTRLVHTGFKKNETQVEWKPVQFKDMQGVISSASDAGVVRDPSVDGGEFCTTREAAQLLQVSLRTAQIWTEQGLLDAWKTRGGHRRITRRSVDRLIAERSADRGAPKGSSPAVVSTSHGSAAVRVLVVEDDASLLKLYRARINSWPTPVELATAKNGYEALVRLGAMLPQLLISDLRLPGLDGFDLLRAICAIDELADLQIAVVTGLDQSAIEERGGLPGRVRLFSKPIPFDELERLVAEIASGSGNSVPAPH